MTSYTLRKIGKALKEKRAIIRGLVLHDDIKWYIIDLLDEQKTTHVPCMLRPSWVKNRYWNY